MTQTVPEDAWTRATTELWQKLDDAELWHGRLAPPWRYRVPIQLPDGRVLELPIRRLPAEPRRAVASLIANQASFAVVEALSAIMSLRARTLGAQVVIGLPTLGMVFAPMVAQALGHERWVPLGYSRKFWYDEALSTEVSSITTPGAGKRIYLDPNQLSLLTGRRVLVVDDAISSGRTLARVLDLLEHLKVDVADVLVAMRQGNTWRDALGARRTDLVHGVFDSPLLELRDDGWWPSEGANTTQP